MAVLLLVVVVVVAVVAVASLPGLVPQLQELVDHRPEPEDDQDAKPDAGDLLLLAAVLRDVHHDAELRNLKQDTTTITNSNSNNNNNNDNSNMFINKNTNNHSSNLIRLLICNLQQEVQPVPEPHGDPDLARDLSLLDKLT